jgi:hypothetical protein
VPKQYIKTPEVPAAPETTGSHTEVPAREKNVKCKKVQKRAISAKRGIEPTRVNT